MKYLLVILITSCALLFQIRSSYASETEVSLEEIAVTGVDRSSLEISPEIELVKLEKEKIIIGERTGSRPPFSLGPFSLWARSIIGTDEFYKVSLLSGLTGKTTIGDLQTDYTKRAWRRNGETASFGGGSLLLTKRFTSDLELRLSCSVFLGQYDLLGSTYITEACDRVVESYKFNLEAGYPVGSRANLFIGLFYDSAEVDRNAVSSERMMGISLTLDSESVDVTFKGWSYSFSKGEEQAYATLEARFAELYRRRDFNLSGSLGFNLVDDNSILLSPIVSLTWKPVTRLKLIGTFGIEHRLPSMYDEILKIPEFDPFEESPETIRDAFALITTYLGLSRMSEVRLTLDYRSVKNAIYFERSPDGYLDLKTMEDCGFFKTTAEADVWLTNKIKVFGSVKLAFAQPSDEYDHFPYLPTTEVHIGASLRIGKNWTFTAEIEDKGRVFTNTNEGLQLDSFTLVNLELSYKIEEYMTFFVRVSNLTDEKYFDYDGWKGFEQTLRFGLEVTF